MLPVGGAGGEGGGGGQEGDSKMAGTDYWLFKLRWRLQGEIPHLACLLEAAGLTQSAHNGWLQRNCEPLTRASTAAMIAGEVKCDQRRPNCC